MTLVAAPKTPRRLSPLGGLKAYDPDAWAKKIRAAMKDADGRVPDAAEALEISVRQLFRWLEDPLLKGAKRAPPSVHRGSD